MSLSTLTLRCRHLLRSADIGAFSVISEESIAKGIRRIVGVTGQAAAEAAQQAQGLYERIRDDGATAEDVKQWTEELNTATIPLVDKDKLRKQGRPARSCCIAFHDRVQWRPSRRACSRRTSSASSR